jgi:hypothetical protein
VCVCRVRVCVVCVSCACVCRVCVVCVCVSCVCRVRVCVVCVCVSCACVSCARRVYASCACVFVVLEEDILVIGGDNCFASVSSCLATPPVSLNGSRTSSSNVLYTCYNG